MDSTGAFSVGGGLDGDLPAGARADAPDGVPASSCAAHASGSSAGPAPAAVDFAQRRSTVADCIAALRDLRATLVACPNGEVAALAGELSALRALAGAGLVAVTAEAESRGIIGESQSASTAAWVGEVAWFSRRESSTIAKAAALFRDAELEPIVGAVETCDMDLGSAVVVAAEFAKLAPDLVDAAKPIVLDSMLDVAVEGGPASVRRLKDEILARYGAEGEFEKREERLRRHIELSIGRRTAGGMWDYRLVLDPESRAVLEAVIGPGSAPRPNLETGARDSRSAGQRRGEALTDALRRSVTATAQVPTSPKATVMVTMDYKAMNRALARRRSDVAGDGGGVALDRGELVPDGDTFPSNCGRFVPDRGAFGSDRGSFRGAPAGHADCGAADCVGDGTADCIGEGLANRIGGLVIGSLARDTLLSPATVRRLACDAAIIPVVLSSDSEILDQGRALRLFNTNQVRTLWQRDLHCTFPGCDVPAAWCDAHHLIHWIDGGETTVGNGALLCARHHTVVHRDRLSGSLPTVESRSRPPMPGAVGPPGRPGGKVIWDLRPGSYDADIGVEPRAA